MKSENNICIKFIFIITTMALLLLLLLCNICSSVIQKLRTVNILKLNLKHVPNELYNPHPKMCPSVKFTITLHIIM